MKISDRRIGVPPQVDELTRQTLRHLLLIVINVWVGYGVYVLGLDNGLVLDMDYWMDYALRIRHRK